MKSISLLFGLVASVFGFAQDKAADLTDLRLSVTDAAIRIARGTRSTTFSLEWEYLPPSKTHPLAFILPPGFRAIGKSKTFRLNNDDFRDLDSWFLRLNRDEQKTLLEALTAKRYEGSSLPKLSVALADNVNIYDSFGTGTNVPMTSEFLPARRDHYLMKFLLGAFDAGSEFKRDGARMIVFPTQDAGAMASRKAQVFNSQIKWEINAVQVWPELAGSTGDPIYRFAVRAYVPRVTISATDVGSDDEKVTVNFRAISSLVNTIKDSKDVALDMRTLGEIRQDVELARGNVKGLPTDDLTPGTSVANVTLSTITGASMTSSILGLLTSMDADTRLFSGGLLGDGLVTPLVGTNFFVSRRENSGFGLSLGVATEKNNQLYLGPFAQWGPVIFGAGARFFSREDGATIGKFAGAISFDLASLWEKPGRTFSLKSSREGKDASILGSSDFLAAQSFVEFRWVVPGDFPAGGKVLFMATNERGEPLKDGPTFAADPRSRRPYILPAGMRFKLEAPESWKVMPAAYLVPKLNLPTNFVISKSQ